jgi:hypothetical protein
MAQRSGSVVQTFLFADLSGFTALTQAHGDEQAADLVGESCKDWMASDSGAPGRTRTCNLLFRK